MDRSRRLIVGPNLGVTAFNLFVYVAAAWITVALLTLAKVIESAFSLALLGALVVVMGGLAAIMSWYRKTGRV